MELHSRGGGGGSPQGPNPPKQKSNKKKSRRKKLDWVEVPSSPTVIPYLVPLIVGQCTESQLACNANLFVGRLVLFTALGSDGMCVRLKCYVSMNCNTMQHTKLLVFCLVTHIHTNAKKEIPHLGCDLTESCGHAVTYLSS